MPRHNSPKGMHDLTEIYYSTGFDAFALRSFTVPTSEADNTVKELTPPCFNYSSRLEYRSTEQPTFRTADDAITGLLRESIAELEELRDTYESRLESR